MAQGRHNTEEAPFRSLRNPTVLIVDMLLASIVIFFLGITYGYVARLGSAWTDFRLPKVFWLSTLSILMVSFFLRHVLEAYDRDQVTTLKRKIALAFAAALIFSACQVAGWLQLRDQGLLIDTANSVSYVYILTGLHILHVLLGLIFLMVAAFRINRHTATGVQALLYFSDPLRRDRLKLLTHYWHTIDFLWVLLFLAFLFNHT